MGRGGEFVVVVVVVVVWGAMGNIWELRNDLAFEEVGLRRGGGRGWGKGGSSRTSLSLSPSLYRFACGIDRCGGEAIWSAVGRWVDLG